MFKTPIRIPCYFFCHSLPLVSLSLFCSVLHTASTSQPTTTISMFQRKKNNNDIMGETVVEWSDLPSELLPTIGKSLDTSIDILRFRSVSKSWRSSIPPSHTNSPPFPLKFPNPYGVSAGEAYLHESTVYRLELHKKKTDPSISSSRGWLVKLEESYSGKLRLIDTLSNHHISYPPNVSFPKVLNLLGFRVVEISKAYGLKYANRFSTRSEENFMMNENCILGVNKVVLFPNSAWTNVEECVIFVIFHDGKLGFAKYGDDNLTRVDKKNFEYDDIIVYKGKFYVVNRLGIVYWIDDSSLKLIQFLPPLCGLGHQKHLVESCGALYVVDRYLDKERRKMRNNRYVANRDYQTVDFEVYKLDEEWGHWVLVRNLGDRAFILSKDCSFTISAREFARIQRNCIYFTDPSGSRVFNLADRSFIDIPQFPNHFHAVWPSLAWLSLNSMVPDKLLVLGEFEMDEVCNL